MVSSTYRPNHWDEWRQLEWIWNLEGYTSSFVLPYGNGYHLRPIARSNKVGFDRFPFTHYSINKICIEKEGNEDNEFLYFFINSYFQDDSIGWYTYTEELLHPLLDSPTRISSSSTCAHHFLPFSPSNIFHHTVPTHLLSTATCHSQAPRILPWGMLSTPLAQLYAHQMTTWPFRFGCWWRVL